jgi:alkyl hydroperoxide reductase subunit AhpC/uncharacterized protein (DUF924 family)/CRP-like cAMP-binding protein
MQTVAFAAGETIFEEGQTGESAYLLKKGTVDVIVGNRSAAKIIGTLSEGEVFGEMCLIDPGPRSATIKAATDIECEVIQYENAVGGAPMDPIFAQELTRTLVRRLRKMNERVAAFDPGTSQRIQQCLRVILAGLDEHDALFGADLEVLEHGLRLLLQSDRLQISDEEIARGEAVLNYMLRPSMEECLTLWFGKSEETDQEIWRRFGADVDLASRGHYDHWAMNLDHPRLLVALVIMLDQFPRNIHRDTEQMYGYDARCLSLVKRGLRTGVVERLRPAERVFLCLALTHSESLDDQHRCMLEWGSVMKELRPGDPLNVFHEIFHRHVAVVQRFGRFPHRNELLKRPTTEAEREFLQDATFRFDLPLVRGADGRLVFAGAVKRRTVKVLDHEYQTLMPDENEAPATPLEFAYTGPDAGFTRTQEQLKKQGYIRIGDMVPDFTAETSEGPLGFYDYVGDSWCVLFSHPADFTPVCTTELVAAARLESEWALRGVKLIGLSVDDEAQHSRWISDIADRLDAKVGFPIIADKDRCLSMLFGLLDPTRFGHGASLGETMTVGSVFVISPGKRVELIQTYPAHIGRNFEEILRVIDALQFSSKSQVATPANWRPGEDTVVLPFISDEEAEQMFPNQHGVQKVRSHLRFLRDPSLRVL